jgi:hypothetical protein
MFAIYIKFIMWQRPPAGAVFTSFQPYCTHRLLPAAEREEGDGKIASCLADLLCHYDSIYTSYRFHCNTNLPTESTPGKDRACHISIKIPVVIQAEKSAAPGTSFPNDNFLLQIASH